MGSTCPLPACEANNNGCATTPASCNTCSP
jgi:hypothetical protein